MRQLAMYWVGLRTVLAFLQTIQQPLPESCVLDLDLWHVAHVLQAAAALTVVFIRP
jgi:hypothetical protein